MTTEERITQLKKLVEDDGDPACAYCGRPCNPIVVAMSYPFEPMHQKCFVRNANGIPAPKRRTRV